VIQANAHYTLVDELQLLHDPPADRMSSREHLRKEKGNPSIRIVSSKLVKQIEVEKPGFAHLSSPSCLRMNNFCPSAARTCGP